jgi:hypothetical protein
MGPISKVSERKRFKIYLDPMIYELFRGVCRSRGLRRVNRVLECFMLAASYNPILLILVKDIAEKRKPDIFHEPSDLEEGEERLRKLKHRLSVSMYTMDSGEG